MIRRATIILYLDPVTYRQESGRPLTKEALERIGSEINDGCATLYGYESWETKFVNVPERRR